LINKAGLLENNGRLLEMKKVVPHRERLINDKQMTSVSAFQAFQWQKGCYTFSIYTYNYLLINKLYIIIGH